VMNRYLLLIRVALRASRLILFGLIVLALILTSTPLTSVEAAAGDLDPTFGSAGKVTTDFNQGADYGHAVAVQGDGKIVVAGFTVFSMADFALARYDVNGNLDPSFGSGGKVTTDFSNSDDVVSAMAIQSDGKIVVAGAMILNGTAEFEDFALARYNTDGSLDTSFGSGGKVTTDFLGGPDGLHAMAIQNDGKLVVAGSEGYNFALARYDSHGNLDASFGSGGKVITDFDGGVDGAYAVALQADGKIIAAGQSGLSFALARYDANGNLDVGFGSGGKVISDFSGNFGDITAIALQADGRIVAAGYTGFYDFALARYEANGQLDSSFGAGGKVITDFSGGSDDAFAVTLQKDGKIIAAGSSAGRFSGASFALARYDSKGGLDPSFGAGGKLTTSFADRDDEAYAMAFQPDGKLVVCGEAYQESAGYFNFALARYQVMSFDLCVQDDSSGNLLQINTTTGEYQFTNCGGLTLGGTGTLTRRGSQITLQHNAADRRVIATIDTSTNKATASLQLFAQGRTFSITDRNITNNTCACR
jgi:uncharacterized delta-60 repeat protein